VHATDARPAPHRDVLLRVAFLPATDISIFVKMLETAPVVKVPKPVS